MQTAQGNVNGFRSLVWMECDCGYIWEGLNNYCPECFGLGFKKHQQVKPGKDASDN